MALGRYSRHSVFFRLLLPLFFTSCMTDGLRLPSSVSETYSNSEMRQSLVLAAQNKILFQLPPETISEVEKTEIDHQCKHFESPFWAEKLSVYLSLFRSRPELLTKIHIIEIKKGDAVDVQIQNDMDQVSVLKIQYVKSEKTGKVVRSTNLPCDGNSAEFVGKDIVKTEFEFPTTTAVLEKLESAPERKNTARFDFSTDFLTYLAQRGLLFRFSHEFSFEKLPNGQFIMAQVLNRYAEEIKNLNKIQVGQKSYLNFWIKKINENSKQAELIQFFGIENDEQLRAGIKINSEKEIEKAKQESSDITYLFTSYRIEADHLLLTSLDYLNQCLQKISSDVGSSFFRRPASESEKRRYLYPGYSCKK